jgi:hypothetical protein
MSVWPVASHIRTLEPGSSPRVVSRALWKEWIRKLLSNFSNHLRMARRQQHRNTLRLGKFYKLEVSLTWHQHIDDDKVVVIGFELTLRERPSVA